MITRRLFAGMFPGAAVSAPSILKSAAQSFEQMPRGAEITSGFDAKQYISSGLATSNKVSAPKMNYEAALQAAKNIPWIKDKLREHYAEQAKHVSRIDYDILNKKSWSDMYKVTVQIERNLNKLVEQDLNYVQTAHNSPLHDLIHKMMWGKE